MEYVKLSNTELSVSRIGFGCYQLPLVSKEKTEILIRYAIEKGINFFETARDYRDSEEKIGNALYDRDEIVLATKMGTRKPLNIRKILAVSLKKLQTEYLDIYSMQGVNTLDKLADYEKTILPEFLKLKKEGTIRYIGMTSHEISVIEEAKRRELEIDVFFTPANIMLRHPIQVGIPIVAIKPFGGYKYSYMQGQDVKYIHDTLEFEEWFTPEIALNYLLQFDNVKSILCGFTSIGQIDVDCKVESERMVDLKSIIRFKFTKFEDDYCDECGKCSCPNGIRIPFLMKLWKYYDFYNIKRWTKTCYNMLDADYRECNMCLKCVEQCPKHIAIITMLQKLEEELRE